MNDLCTKMGARIRALRKKAGLTISQLAELAEVDGGFLNYIENGKKTPSLATVEKIARGLKVPVSDLFRETNPPRKEEFFDAKILHQLRSLFHKKSSLQKENLLIVLKLLKILTRFKP